MFLLDTDALSELEKASPDRGLLAWLESVDWLDTNLSVITIEDNSRDMGRTGASVLDPWETQV